MQWLCSYKISTHTDTLMHKHTDTYTLVFEEDFLIGIDRLTSGLIGLLSALCVVIHISR